MEYFKVIDIQDANTRPKEWNLEEYKNRKVLHLSNKIFTCKFSEYKEHVGYSKTYKLMGTTYGKPIKEFKKIKSINN